VALATPDPNPIKTHHSTMTVATGGTALAIHNGNRAPPANSIAMILSWLVVRAPQKTTALMPPALARQCMP